MNLNTKNIYIDADEARTMAVTGSTTSANIVVYRGSEYVLRANVYSNVASTTVSSFANTTGWSLSIGRAYDLNSAPVIVEANVASWNNVSDWSVCDPLLGAISVRINTAGSLVSTDLGNNSSQKYTMEIWYQSNLSSMMVLSDNIYIHNSTVA